MQSLYHFSVSLFVVNMTLLAPYMTMYIPTLGVLFTGKSQPVLGKDGVQLLGNDGMPRVGRGFSESTFRKYYHGLKTLHKHFQKETE